MKNTMKKKWIVILMVPILLITVLLIGLNSSPEKNIVGNWELKALCEDNSLDFGYSDKYAYFNVHISDDGVINIWAYPNEYAGLGTLSFIEKSDNKIYKYAVELIINNDSGELDTFGAKLEYSETKDELRLFVSENDGFFFKRTNELTTIEITTTEEPTQSPEEEMLDYKSLCVDYINSKDLVRHEDRYVGGKYCYTGQVMFCLENNVYMIFTNELHNGSYENNWIYVKDRRSFDKTKILYGDVITIYGTFTGVSEENYPYFDLYYADIK